MKRFLFVFFLGCLLAGPLALSWQASLAKEQPQQATDDSSFWDIFRKAFSRPEPTYKPATSGKTEVAGVRGVDTEGKLSTREDWDTVFWMEQYQLNESSVKDFLQVRGLGPFKGQGGGK